MDYGPFDMCVCDDMWSDHSEDGCWVEIDDGYPYACPCKKFVPVDNPTATPSSA